MRSSPAAPAEPQKKGGAKKVVFSIIGIVVAAIVFAIVRFGLSEVIAFVTGDTAKAEAGDCITNNTDPNNMKIVDCADAEAAYKVVGVAEDKTQEAGSTACAAFAEAQEYLFLYEGELTATTTGRVLCLAPNAK